MAARWRRARGRRSRGRELSRLVAPAAAAALVVAFLLGALSQVERGSGPYRQTVDRGFAALAGSVSAQSDATASSIGSLLDRAPSMERLSLFSGLDRAAAATAGQAQRLDSVVPPPPSVDLGCLRAMRSRATATAVIRSQVEGLLGGPSGGPATSSSAVLHSVQEAALVLAGADADWAACRRALRAAPGHPVLSASRWLTDPARWSPLALSSLVAAVDTSPSLAARPALALTTFDTDPDSMPGVSGMEVPATGQLAVHVVVTDTGNVDEAAVQVRATLTGARSAALSSIVALKAGRSATVVLGPFTVDPGAGYTLLVTAATPGGVGANASWALQVATIPTTTTTTTTTSTTVATTHPKAVRAPVDQGP